MTSPAFIPEDLPCLRCGYNLRGLPGGGDCPECAEPVAVALRGDRLCYSDPAWVRTLGRGANGLRTAFLLSVLGLPITIGALFLTGSLSNMACVMIFGAVGLVLLLIALVLVIAGALLMTRPEPDRHLHMGGFPPRNAVRATLLAFAIGVGLIAFGWLSGWPAAAGIGVFTALGAILLVLPAVIILQARRLARRLPDDAMAVTFTNVLGIHLFAGTIFITGWVFGMFGSAVAIGLVLVAAGLWVLFLMAAGATMTELTATLTSGAYLARAQDGPALRSE